MRSRGVYPSVGEPEDIAQFGLKCEWCFEAPIADIHHIQLKGMGGSKKLDGADNLIGLCRKHHDASHGLSGPFLSASELQERVKLILNTIGEKNG